MIPPLLVVVTLVFLVIQFIPGDPVTVMMGKNADPEVAAALRAEYGFDKPPLEQYWNWLSGLVPVSYTHLETFKVVPIPCWNAFSRSGCRRNLYMRMERTGSSISKAYVNRSGKRAC